ncbi:MAG: hypothetical protein OEY97_04855 [Nitrospirota bacterium]|nr:hypothetical protein [Nitrospirota bacterium]
MVWFKETDNRVPPFSIECMERVSAVPNTPEKTPHISCQKPSGDYALARTNTQLVANVIERQWEINAPPSRLDE